LATLVCRWKNSATVPAKSGNSPRCSGGHRT
jgi:hypothetical protein